MKKYFTSIAIRHSRIAKVIRSRVKCIINPEIWRIGNDDRLYIAVMRMKIPEQESEYSSGYDDKP
jgi:hypothetical protein